MYHSGVQKYRASDGFADFRLYPIVTGRVIWVWARDTSLMNPQWQSMLPAPGGVVLWEGNSPYNCLEGSYILTSTLDGGEQLNPRPRRFTHRNDAVRILQEVGWTLDGATSRKVAG
jgi:hypothetical protein